MNDFRPPFVLLWLRVRSIEEEKKVNAGALVV
jgi:hypothetical protein